MRVVYIHPKIKLNRFEFNPSDKQVIQNMLDLCRHVSQIYNTTLLKMSQNGNTI
jgi:hypothetical protein